MLIVPADAIEATNVSARQPKHFASIVPSPSRLTVSEAVSYARTKNLKGKYQEY
jgi:hypothetical protein